MKKKMNTMKQAVQDQLQICEARLQDKEKVLVDLCSNNKRTADEVVIMKKKIQAKDIEMNTMKQAVQNKLQICEARLQDKEKELVALCSNNKRTADEVVIMKKKIQAKDIEMNTTKQTVQDQLQICEARLQDKEKELVDLRSNNKRTADEVFIMKKKIQSKDIEMNTMKQTVQNKLQICEARLQDKEKELVALCSNNKRTADEVVIMKKKIQSKDIEMNTMKQTVQNKLQICEARLQDKEKELVDLRSNNKRTADEAVIMKKEIQSKDIEMNTMKQRITALEKKRFSGDEFEWNLQNYYHCKENGEAYSPGFIMAGRCCMLGVEWFGRNKGRLGIFFYLCDGVKCRGNRYFNYDVQIEMHGIDGVCQQYVIDSSEIETNLIDCQQPCRDDEPVGNDYFLNMPRLRRFVVNNCLDISCKLILA